QIVTSGLERGVEMNTRLDGVVLDLEDLRLHFRRCEADLRSVLEVTATDRHFDVGSALSSVRENPANVGARRRHLLRHNNHGHETGQSEPITPHNRQNHISTGDQFMIYDPRKSLELQLQSKLINTWRKSACRFAERRICQIQRHRSLRISSRRIAEIHAVKGVE